MGLEQFLTAEDKVASLEALRGRLFSELYALCIRAGIDPDTVDYQTWVLPDEDETNSSIYGALKTIGRMCDSLNIIDSKLA